MTPAEQNRFDALLQDAIDALPARFRAVLDEVPVIVIDRPDRKLLRELREEGVIPSPESNPRGDEGSKGEGHGGASTGDDEDLMGLHTGVAITERGLDQSGQLPGTIHVFREGILSMACGDEGWSAAHADQEVYEEVRITLLHEIGHHFGLDEDDLDELGYS